MNLFSPITTIASTPAARRVGNWLYRHAFPIYRPIYSMFKACEDRAERRFVARNLSAGDVAVDVGANIGIYSRFLAKCVGPTGLLHSFEPAPENFAHLRAALRNVSNARLNQLAVSDLTGSSNLYLSAALNVDHRAYPVERELRTSIPIRCIRLDDYFQAGERVDFIKLDVQGYELHVLRGAERVLCDSRRVKLLLELWPYGLRQAGASWKQLVDLLHGNGMSIQQFSANDLRPLNVGSLSEAPEWYVNVVAYRVE